MKKTNKSKTKTRQTPTATKTAKTRSGKFSAQKNNFGAKGKDLK